MNQENVTKANIKTATEIIRAAFAKERDRPGFLRRARMAQALCRYVADREYAVARGLQDVEDEVRRLGYEHTDVLRLVGACHQAMRLATQSEQVARV